MDIVFDLETKESFDDVGGRKNLERLTISVLGYYRYDTDAFGMLEEDELDAFGELLNEDGARLIGFNIHGFDIPVLKKYIGPAVTKVATVDMMDDVKEAIGRRLPLQALLAGTLGEGKSGDGLEAIRLWADGKKKEVKQYCHDDVRLTRDLYDYGKEHGEIYFTSNVDETRYAVPVAWGGGSVARFDSLLAQAHEAQLCVAVTFATDSGDREGILEPHRLDDQTVEGVLRETGERIRIEKTALKNARLVVQRFSG